MELWWHETSGGELLQGDLLRDCLLPLFRSEPLSSIGASVVDQEVRRARLIVVTQSCDLASGRAEFVALCPLHTLAEFERVNPEFARKGRWEGVRKGRVEGLHLLASPTQPANNHESLVVDFGHIVSVPYAYAVEHAESFGARWRLASPYLEHFSQAFARFFMRVGLPAAIPEFK